MTRNEKYNLFRETQYRLSKAIQNNENDLKQIKIDAIKAHLLYIQSLNGREPNVG